MDWSCTIVYPQQQQQQQQQGTVFLWQFAYIILSKFCQDLKLNSLGLAIDP
jgi:hypothetical protein